jgi:4,5-dihydroxyphthalate decarboxylase
MSPIKLTIATTDYDHFRDFRIGAVRADGIAPIWLTLGHHEIFSRFTLSREWDVSELSFAKFMAQVTRKNSDIIGLPVYASRLFRFSSFYVNRNMGIKTAKDLRGKRIGVPEWAHTAAVWMRGWLQHECGIPLSEIDWVQAGTNEAGRIEKVEITLPKSVRLTPAPDKTLSGMIASGELDCVIIARPPNAFREKHPDVMRLYPDFEEMERRYYKDTNIYPIMHVIALRKSVLDANPWIARNLYKAFEESKRRSIERLLDPAVSRYPLPWLANYAARIRDEFGGELFPYGIEENRATLELFLRYTHEQGIAHKLVKPEDIFPAGMAASVKV